MQQKLFFIFFSSNLPARRHIIFSLKNLIFFAKIVCENFILQALFRSANTFMRKRKDPDPYLWLMDPDPQHWFSLNVHFWVLFFLAWRAFTQNFSLHSPRTWSGSPALRAHCVKNKTGLAIKNPPKKTTLKNPLKMFFLVFLIFNFLWK